MKINQDVLVVLDRAVVTNNRLVLQGTLDRKLYADVNKVLEAIGGKWNRGAKAHVFEMPVADVLDPIMETGEYSRTKQDFGQFDSPSAVVARVIQLSRIESGMAVLEPSAGLGNIARAAEAAGGRVTAIEIDSKRAKALGDIPHIEIHVDDFLSIHRVASFDRVVMNPPFARQDDIRHVLHASRFLKPGGRLVSVMSASVMFRDNRATVEFRQFVTDQGGEFERLPEGSFASSGTSIHSCIVHFDA